MDFSPDKNPFPVLGSGWPKNSKILFVDLRLQQKEWSHAENIRRNDYWVPHDHDTLGRSICCGQGSGECANLIYWTNPATRHHHHNSTTCLFKYLPCFSDSMAHKTCFGHKEDYQTIAPTLLENKNPSIPRKQNGWRRNNGRGSPIRPETFMGTPRQN